MQRRLEEIAQVQPDGGAHQGPEQSACASYGRLHDELARRFERERIRRHEGLQHPEQTSRQSGIGGSDHEGGKLVAMNVVADGGGTQRIVPDGVQDRADRRTHDAQCDHNPEEIPECQEHIEGPVGVEPNGRKAEMRLGVGTPGKPFSPPV